MIINNRLKINFYTILLSGILFVFASSGKAFSNSKKSALLNCSNNTPENILVVLGNEPLDSKTPTVDMVMRVRKSVEFVSNHPNTIVVFTGGCTVGKISEAKMMASIAYSLGMPKKVIILENRAKSTSQNAHYSAKLLKNINNANIWIVSKKDHLNWAIPIFKEYKLFKNAKPLGVYVSRKESIKQMRKYLQKKDSPRVRRRLSMLLQNVKGVD